MKFIGQLINFLNIIFNLYYNLRYPNRAKQSFQDYFKQCFEMHRLTQYNIKTHYSHQSLNAKKIKKFRKSDTVFIFGSGSSLNEISDSDWEKMNKFDTIGFNNTIHLSKINFTFHINRELVSCNENKILKQLEIIEKNNFLDQTIFLMPKGLTASYTHWIFFKNFWSRKKLFYLFDTNSVFKKPYGNLDTGLIHKKGTLTDSISFAYYMGYTSIVLVGVDLYDRRYFHVQKDRTTDSLGEPVVIDNQGRKVSDTHQTALNGIVNIITEWEIFFKEKKVSLLLFNEKSLLKNFLRIFKF